MAKNKFPGIDISYAMSRDARLINWLRFFDKINKSPLEWVAASDLAERWQTTAVADVSVYLPRYNKTKMHRKIGAPLDIGLVYMTNEFIKQVKKKNNGTASNIYKSIQKRGLELTFEFLEL